ADSAAAVGLDPKRAGEPDEIDPGIIELHADIALGLLGKPAHCVQALLEYAIGAVVENHEHCVDVVACRGPKPLAGIHRAAVAYEPDNRALRQSKLHAHGRRQAPANAAAAQPEIALRIVAANQLANAGPRRERLLDDDC